LGILNNFLTPNSVQTQTRLKVLVYNTLAIPSQ